MAFAMSNSPKSKDLGPLASAALCLENDFKEIERLSLILNEVTQGTQIDLNHAKKLLSKFSEVGLRIGEQIQILAKSLDEGRQRAEAATHEVGKASALIRERQGANATITERFQSLGERVQGLSTSMSNLRENAGTAVTSEDKIKIQTELLGYEEQVGALAEEALRIRDEAQTAKLKDLEREASNMAKSLQTTHKKLKMIAESQPEGNP
jgi:hypothetical protein